MELSRFCQVNVRHFLQMEFKHLNQMFNRSSQGCEDEVARLVQLSRSGPADSLWMIIALWKQDKLYDGSNPKR